MTKNCHFSNFLNHLLLSEKMHRGPLTSEDGESLNYKLQPFATCANFGIGGFNNPLFIIPGNFLQL